jgi:two-component system LytT family response regulator
LSRKIRALIVDDESLAREALVVMLDDDPEIEVIGECRNGKEAITAIREQSPEVVFLDIQMPEMDGFQVVEEVGARRMPVTIFVTAYDKHALRAFEAHALDYLLKPFDHDRFESALQRAKNFVRQQTIGEISESLLAVLQDLKLKAGESPPTGDNRKPQTAAQKEPLDRVVIKLSGGIYFLKIEEIDWVEGAGDYLSLHSGSQTHLIRETKGFASHRADSNKHLLHPPKQSLRSTENRSPRLN